MALLGCAAIAASPARAEDCASRLRTTDAIRGSAELSSRTLIELRDFRETSISPDGKWGALILRRADIEHDRYCMGVVLVPLDGGEAQLVDVGGEPILARADIRGIADVVTGTITGAAPVWSPDGGSIAYLRRDGGATHVWVAAIGQMARPLIGIADDPRSLEWASATVLRLTVRSTEDAEAAIAREGRSGYLYDRRFWTLSEARPSPGPSPFKTIAVDVTTGRQLADLPRPLDPERPANATLYASFPGGGKAWVSPVAAGRFDTPSILQVEDRGRPLPCGEACGSRVVGIWVRGEREFLFLRGGNAENGGRTELYRWLIGREAAPRVVLGTNDLLESCHLAGRLLLCARETARRPRTIAAIDPDTGVMTDIYDPNPEFPAAALGPVARLRWTAADGIASYGDLVLPPDHRTGQRHPLVIMQYTSQGFLRGGVGDEYPIYLFAARGYAVLSAQRPRAVASGSDAVDLDSYQRINVRDLADRRRILAGIEAGIDAAIARGVVDPARIGLTGLSDGAATVQFALLNSKRIRAAAASSCCESPSAAAAVGPAYEASIEKWGYPPAGLDDPIFWRPYSLAANAAAMRTPLLLQLTDREFRLSLETFSALDHARAPVEMYVFPDEYHVKYHPAHRFAVYERSLAWFDFWLRGVVSEDAGSAETMARWKVLRSRLSN
jgi:dipeptidyl aminopeptidase/acylaminoacyl peptidase